MGTISTEAKKVLWNVNSGIQNGVRKLADLRDAVVGKVSAGAAGILNGDVVGINEAQIPNMQNAIRQYVESLEKHLNEVRTEADNSQAFKGQYAEATKEFVSAVCECCECVISNLLEFNKKLDEVYAKYKAKDEQMASDIKSQAGDLQSQFTKYTE